MTCTYGNRAANIAAMDKLSLWHNIERRLDASSPDWRARTARFGQVTAKDRRDAGAAWSDNDVFEALVMAVLSNNTDWSKVESVRPDLGDLFQQFDPLAHAALSEADINNTFQPWFTARRAGSMTLRRNLINLIRAARTLAQYSRERGTADSYFTSLVHQCQGDPKQAALLLGNDARYKLPAIGIPLAAETLRNLGFDVAKPDRHVMRAVGCFKLVDFGAWSSDRRLRTRTRAPNPSCKRQFAAMVAVEEIARSAQESVILVDSAIWQLCAKSGLNLVNADLEQLASADNGDGLVALLESWMQENPAEQRETLAHLIQVLDEDRPSNRKLFPKAMKGKTW